MWTKIDKDIVENDFQEFVKRNELTKLVDEDPTRTFLTWLNNEVANGSLIVKKDNYYRRTYV